MLNVITHADPDPAKKKNYTGLNVGLHTSQMDGGTLQLSTETQGPNGDLSREPYDEAKLIVAYRHSDIGTLTGTTETILPIGELPWNGLPAFEFTAIQDQQTLLLKLWKNTITLPVDQVTRVRFASALLFFRNFGCTDQISWTEEELTHGPLLLQREVVDLELTLTPKK